MKLIEAQENMGQEYLVDWIKDGFQTNLDESSHNIEKLRKSAEKLEFEY